MGVLQLVGLDVLPEGLDDAGAGLRVNAKQASQARVQLKLGRLWRRCNRITTLFFFLQPPTSEPLHQLRHIRQPYRVSPPTPARKRMSGFDSGAFTMQRPHVSGGYQRCEACRLSPQQSCDTGGSYLWTESPCTPHLVVQHQQQSAAHAHVSWPFHLEAVRLLGGGRAMPLEQQAATH